MNNKILIKTSLEDMENILDFNSKYITDEVFDLNYVPFEEFELLITPKIKISDDEELKPLTEDEINLSYNYLLKNLSMLKEHWKRDDIKLKILKDKDSPLYDIINQLILLSGTLRYTVTFTNNSITIKNIVLKTYIEFKNSYFSLRPFIGNKELYSENQSINDELGVNDVYIEWTSKIDFIFNNEFKDKLLDDLKLELINSGESFTKETFDLVVNLMTYISYSSKNTEVKMYDETIKKINNKSNNKSKKSKKKNKQTIIHQKTITITSNNINQAKELLPRNYNRYTDEWFVRGFWRTYKSGKKVWIKPKVSKAKKKTNKKENVKTYVVK